MCLITASGNSLGNEAERAEAAVTRLATSFDRSQATTLRSVAAASALPLPPARSLPSLLLPYSVSTAGCRKDCELDDAQLLSSRVRIPFRLFSTCLGASPTCRPPSFLHLRSFGLRNSSFVGITRSRCSLPFLVLRPIADAKVVPSCLPPLQLIVRASHHCCSTELLLKEHPSVPDTNVVIGSPYRLVARGSSFWGSAAGRIFGWFFHQQRGGSSVNKA